MLKTPALYILIASSLLCSAVWAAQADAPVSGAQDPKLVATQVEIFLRGQASSYPGTAGITVDTSRIEDQAACENLQTFLPGGQRLRARMTVGIRCIAPQTWTAFVQANLSIQGHYYVANRHVAPGDILSLDDLSSREGDVLRMSGGIVFDPSQAVGYIASQRIAAGMPIKSRSLRDPDSVQRGQNVRTEARGAGFLATGEGQALQSGTPGSQIQIRSSSGQIVSGTVLNANTVQVIM